MTTATVESKAVNDRRRVVGTRFNVCDHHSIAQWLDAEAPRSRNEGEARYVCVANVTDVMDAYKDDSYAEALEASNLTVPDGKPVVWAMRSAGSGIRDNVRGADLMESALTTPSVARRRHVLIGGTQEGRYGLRRRFPEVNWVGEIDFHFNALNDEKYQRILDQYKGLDPDYAWVSLGGGKQVRFMHRFAPMADRGVFIGVGAAFDFHAGLIKQAPQWMRNAGVEWLHRLLSEPRRLWRRYLVHNPPFLYFWLRDWAVTKLVKEPAKESRQCNADARSSDPSSKAVSGRKPLLKPTPSPLHLSSKEAATPSNLHPSTSMTPSDLLTETLDTPTPSIAPTTLRQDAAHDSYDLARPRVLIALPAFNEEESLEPLLDGIGVAMAGSGYDYEIIVVDDGSEDATAQIASQAAFRLPVRLVEHEQNSGLAAALRTGFETAVARARPNDVIITMDADNTHPPGLMLRMLGMVSEGYDVVIGSRFQAGAQVYGVPAHRNLLSYGARWLFKLMLPIRGVRDYTCGYRAYRASVLRDAMEAYGDQFVSERGFSCMVDVLLKLRGRGVVMGEAPMVLRYDLKGGDSKMRVLRTIRQTLSLIVRRRVSR